MTKEEIIGGLQFTVDMFLFDPSTGETYKEPRNDMDKTTIDACKGAIELLKQSSDEAMGVKKLLGIIHKEGVETEVFKALSTWLVNEREAQIRELRQHFQNNERPKKETKKTKKVETVVEIPKEIYERQAWLLNKTIDGTLPLKEPEANDVER